MKQKQFSHTDELGKAAMVDIGNKKDQLRTASAEGYISLSAETIALISHNQIKKGDVLSISEFAGIMASKKTSDIIPLCHPLLITKIDCKCQLTESGVKATSQVQCIGKTGVEMECLTAVSAALLTIYDMCKAVDKNMNIYGIKLLEKTKTDL